MLMSTYSRLSAKELGTVEVILLGFNRHQLPRMLEILTKVEAGSVLDDFEIIFLEETLQEIQSVEYFADNHPEFQTLVCEVARLYELITEKASANQASVNG